MKSLETLLKVAQRRLDDAGRQVATFRRELDGLLLDEAVLSAREERELAAGAADPTLLPFLPAFRRRILDERNRVQLRRQAAEAASLEAAERLKAAFQEKSKFEELLEREQVRVARAREALEQAMLDEAAINRIGRR